MTAETSIVISDLSRFAPREAISREPRRGCWRLVDFRTEDGIEGAMLYAAPEDEAPPLTLDLEARGPHAIHFGFNYTRSVFMDTVNQTPYPLYGTLWAKLSGDPGFSRFAPETRWRQDEQFPDRTGGESALWHAVHEVFWKTVDLDGHTLTIRPPGPPFDGPELAHIANLAYVRLVPLDAAAAQWHRRLEPQPETRRVAVQVCSGHLSGHAMGSDAFHPTDEQWVRDDLAPFLDHDVGLICFEAIRGNLCMFPTRVGDVGTEDNTWPEQWIDPLASAVKVAHEHGTRLFAGMRMMGASLPVVLRPIQWARYYWSHPQWAKRDPQGRPGSNLSIAFEQVRAYWLSLLREALDRGCDGVHLLFDRCWPFVLYEQPSIDLFQQRHGEDPRKLSPDDERWIMHQCEVGTTFVREIGDLVREKRGRELAIHFRAGEYGTWERVEPRRFGCDVETWIGEGLVDILMPTPCGGPEVAESIRAWRRLAGDRVKIYPDLFPRSMPGSAYADLATCLYEAGADGFVMRDAERRAPRASEWAVARHLGHRDMIGELRERWERTYWQARPLDLINGLSVRYSYNDG
ncbi:MAG: hypothetical protein CMJ18_00680 [Phycisphaeraceae bacterium]|nr:hypothetical protein [Phycisphaeraceae bacterium]